MKVGMKQSIVLIVGLQGIHSPIKMEKFLLMTYLMNTMHLQLNRLEVRMNVSMERMFEELLRVYFQMQ